MLTETIGQRRSSNQGLFFWLESSSMLSITTPYLRTNQHGRLQSTFLEGLPYLWYCLCSCSPCSPFTLILVEDTKHLAWGHFQGRLQLMLKIPLEVNAGETHRTEE